MTNNGAGASSQSKRELLFVHDGPCKDGEMCAWIASRRWDEDPDVELKIIWVNHAMGDGKRLAKIKQHLKPHTELYIADLTLSREEYDALLSPDEGPNGEKLPRLKSITTLDHHKTTKQDMDGYQPPLFEGFQTPAFTYDNEPEFGSAAELVWARLFPDQEAPRLVSFIGKMEPDGELKDEDERALAAYIDSRNTFDSLANLKEYFNMMTARMSIADMIREGHSILKDQRKNIDALLEHIMYCQIELLPGCGKVWVPILPVSPKFFGRTVGEAMVAEAKKGTSPGVVLFWSPASSGVVHMSIRTDGFPDAGDIATHLKNTIALDGGGHGKGAGVQFKNLRDFMEKVNPVTAEDMRRQIHTPTPVSSPAPGQEQQGPQPE